MAAYLIPFLLGVAVLFGGVVAFGFYKAIRSASGPYAPGYPGGERRETERSAKQ